MKNKYVISAELDSATGLDPGRIMEFRENLTADLAAMGEAVEWVGIESLREGLKELRQQTTLPVISLDGTYFTPGEKDDVLGISRAVQANLSDAGYDARLGFANLGEQLDRLGARYRGGEVALLDDVVFSGKMIAYVSTELARRGVEVPLVLAGIAIGEGQELLEKDGILVQSVRYYGEVKDQLCERDFTLLPGSGRKVAGNEQSAVYFDSRNGNPSEWASIADPDAFCVSSLRRNLELLPPDQPLPNFLGYPQGTVGEVVPGLIEARGRQ